MDILDQLVETRILGAIERGELDNLPGAGKPLVLDDDRLMPEHLRVGYRVLKNAGLLPPELEALRRLHEAGRALGEAGDAPARRRVRARMLALRLQVEAMGLRHSAQAAWREYADQLLRRLGDPAADPRDA